MRAQPLGLRPGDRDVLESWTRSSSIRAGLAQRARIVLLAADGVSNTEIADRVGVSRPTVIGWRERYASSGVRGLEDERRSGRPRTVDRAKILAATLRPPPAGLGVTHWSSRLLADHLEVDASTVLRTWRHHRVQPWRVETFKFSTDPELVAKVTDVVGLYLNPPENAIVLSIDEKSQIQALNRTQKTLPMQPGQAEKRTHDYVRHGTTTLFAALEIATGQVTGVCKPRHRHQEFLVFLRHLARGYPDQQLHLIMDNYGAHKHPKVKAWLAANPRIHIHFTPTSGSWLNLVEVWFGIIERQAIHRGAFPSVRDLMIKIRTFINGWNDRCQPFVWTKTADQILTKANRKTTSRCTAFSGVSPHNSTNEAESRPTRPFMWPCAEKRLQLAGRRSYFRVHKRYAGEDEQIGRVVRQNTARGVEKIGDDRLSWREMEEQAVAERHCDHPRVIPGMNGDGVNCQERSGGH